MNRVIFFTPSYQPDLERCILLRKSTLRFSANEHVFAVPAKELALFRRELPQQTSLIAQEELVRLPLYRSPWVKFPLSKRLWPVRGWIRQQICKLAFAASSEHACVACMDSDVVLTQEIPSDFFIREGKIRLGAVPRRGNGPMHMTWHQVAYRLLGMPDAGYSGYGFIASIPSLSPANVRSALDRLEYHHHRWWQDSIAHQRTFSEFIFYGCHVLNDERCRDRIFIDPVIECLEYWDQEIPLDNAQLHAFIAELRAQHLGIHIQSKAQIDWREYRRLITALLDSSGQSTRDHTEAHVSPGSHGR